MCRSSTLSVLTYKNSCQQKRFVVQTKFGVRGTMNMISEVFTSRESDARRLITGLVSVYRAILPQPPKLHTTAHFLSNFHHAWPGGASQILMGWPDATRMTALEGRRQPDPLVNGTLGVEFGRLIGTADDGDSDTRRLEGRHEFAHRFLTGTHHDRIHLQHTRLALDAQVQPLIIDMPILAASHCGHTSMPKGCPVHPT